MNNNVLIEKLKGIIPNPKSELVFDNSFQLLIAVILSAQCTDKRVNMVTKQLFAKWDTPYKLAKAPIDEVEQVIKPCGFYHNKSRNIISCARDIVEKFGGQVPCDRESLQSLSGVGRKTANVVLAVCYAQPAIAVDTHVYRVARRLGLSDKNNVRGVEDDLMAAFETEDWGLVHHLMLLFGRYHCTARNPHCTGCVLKDFCKYKGGNNNVDG